MKKWILSAFFILLFAIVACAASGVFITNTGEKYHRDGCQHLRQSKIPISLESAKARGYTPCSHCYSDVSAPSEKGSSSSTSITPASAPNPFVPAFVPAPGPFEKLYNGPIIGDMPVPLTPKKVYVEGCCLVIEREQEIARVVYDSPKSAQDALEALVHPREALKEVL